MLLEQFHTGFKSERIVIGFSEFVAEPLSRCYHSQGEALAVGSTRFLSSCYIEIRGSSTDINHPLENILVRAVGNEGSRSLHNHLHTLDVHHPLHPIQAENMCS